MVAIVTDCRIYNRNLR